MAKGLRSKAMRKNRSQLRTTLAEPIIRKRQLAIANSIHNSIKAKNGNSILKLKSLFPNATTTNNDTITNDVNISAMIEATDIDPELNSSNTEIEDSNAGVGLSYDVKSLKTNKKNEKAKEAF